VATHEVRYYLQRRVGVVAYQILRPRDAPMADQLQRLTAGWSWFRGCLRHVRLHRDTGSEEGGIEAVGAHGYQCSDDIVECPDDIQCGADRPTEGEQCHGPSAGLAEEKARQGSKVIHVLH
jgi:hypothetical protein